MTLIPFTLLYLALVLGNGLAFNYSFWNDVPPSDAADTVAVISLWGLALAEGLVGVIGYGWMCRYAIDARRGDRHLWSALRRALMPAIRASWYAIPAFGVAVVSVVLSFPSVLVVGVLGALPLFAVSGSAHPIKEQRRFIVEMTIQAGLVGAAAGLIAIPVWVTLFLTVGIAEFLNGNVQLIGLIPVWLSFVFAALITGGVVSAFEFLRQEHDRRPDSPPAIKAD